MNKKGEELLSNHHVASFELDSFGHVNNAVFLNILEKARCDFLIQRGIHFNDFHQWKKFPVVVKARLEFKNPATAGDHLIIKGRISKATPIRFCLKYEVIHQHNQKIILVAETEHVFINEENRPIRIPQKFNDAFLSPRLETGKKVDR